MLRSIRIRLKAIPRASTRRYSPLSQYKEIINEDADSDATPEVPYGTQYGAGPSRLPYDPNARQSRRTVDQPVHNLDRGSREVRAASTSTGGFFDGSDQDKNDRFSDLTRLQMHQIIHRLIRDQKTTLAMDLISSSVRRRRRFRSRTISATLQAYTGFFGDKYHPFPISFAKIPEPGGNRISPVLRKAMGFVNDLQAARHPRSEDDYKVLMYLCALDRAPDVAAGLYVGLVEEWITEGRVAEGAKADDFYEGGGPPRKGREELELRSDLLKLWWKGVRSWVLPGEVLSPHDRLDLWHPRKLALAEKLRNFPLPTPTSPPTSSPAPTDHLLERVVAILRLDPESFEFEASMRACATLSNTIITRTIPYVSSRILLNTLERIPSHPPVYPEGINPSHSDAWAYAAYTHVHLAIRSLLFYPPASAETIAYHRACEEAVKLGEPKPPIPSRLLYMTFTLSPGGCKALLKYALRKLRRPGLIRGILNYTKRMYGSLDLDMYNKLYREMTLLREWKAVERVERILFAGTAMGTTMNPSRAVNSIDIPTPGVPVKFDSFSLSAHISHLAATGQSNRLIQLTYTLIPFLQFAQNMSLEDTVTLIAKTGTTDLVGDSGRPRPAPLTPYLYAGLISGLARFTQPGLAQRVFHLALQAEDEWGVENGGEAPPDQRIPVHVFTSMIKVWSKQARHTDMLGVETWPIGWSTPIGTERYPRKRAAELMIWLTYRQAVRRYKLTGWDVMRPDERFFDEMIKAVGRDCGVDDLRAIVRDMEMVGVEVPWGLRDALDGRVLRFGKSRTRMGLTVGGVWRGKYMLERRPDEMVLFEKEAESAHST